MTAHAARSPIDKARALEEKFDPEMRFRPIRQPAALLVTALLIVLSCFHYYTAGFGLLRETTHRGVHLAFVLGLIFLVFPLRKAMLEHPPQAGRRPRRAACRWYDWLLRARDRRRRCSTSRTSSTTSRSASAIPTRSTS